MQQTKPRPPRLLHRPFKGNCERCGQEYVVERGGSFGDRDYYELWHEHMALQALYKRVKGFFIAVMRARNAPE